MFWILAILRLARRIKRRALGVHPAHWASDLLFIPLVVLKELAELLPTTSAILLVPRHFFERLPSIIREKPSGGKNLYKTPIGFARQVALLLLAAVGVTYQTLKIGEFHFYVLAVASLFVSVILIPIAVPIACLILAPLHAVLRVLIISASITRYDFRRTGLWLRITLDVASYRNLN